MARGMQPLYEQGILQNRRYTFHLREYYPRLPLVTSGQQSVSGVTQPSLMGTHILRLPTRRWDMFVKNNKPTQHPSLFAAPFPRPKVEQRAKRDTGTAPHRRPVKSEGKSITHWTPIPTVPSDRNNQDRHQYLFALISRNTSGLGGDLQTPSMPSRSIMKLPASNQIKVHEPT